MTKRTATAAPITLNVTTEDIAGGTIDSINQTGVVGGIEYTASAVSGDHGYIQFGGSIYTEADIDRRIAELNALRPAARQVHAVCGF